MLWFMLGIAVGGVLGMIMLALMVAAKEADKVYYHGGVGSNPLVRSNPSGARGDNTKIPIADFPKPDPPPKQPQPIAKETGILHIIQGAGEAKNKYFVYDKDGEYICQITNINFETARKFIKANKLGGDEHGSG